MKRAVRNGRSSSSSFNPQPSGEDDLPFSLLSSPDGCGLNESPSSLFGDFGKTTT